MQHKEGDTPSPRALRQRGAVDYREDNVELDSMLGLGPPGSKPVKRIDVRLLRRKLEQGCTASDLPASPISDLHTQIFDKGFRRPLVVRATAGGSMNGTRQALGLSLPPAIFSAEGLATAVGGDTIIPTFDVHTQDTGPRMNLRQLAEYFATPAKERAKLINVVSFSLADTALQPHIVAPRVVQELDLVRAVWPENERPRPETLLYSLLGPQGAYTDWHVDMGGSSVWYHVLKGCKVFLAAPPTPKNLTTFESWASSEQQLTEFLGDSLEHCVRVSLHAGDTLLLPSGWPHAVSTPEDSVVVGGNFLHGMDYANIAETFRREERLAVAPKFQFPLFKALMWHAARAALDQLKRALRRKRPPEAAGLSVWELQGLPRLVGLLREWKGGAGGSRRGGAPDCIPDPEDFLQDMESSLAAAGIRDVDCDNEHDGSGAEGGMNVAGDDEFGESEGWQDLDEYTPMLEVGWSACICMPRCVPCIGGYHSPKPLHSMQSGQVKRIQCPC